MSNELKIIPNESDFILKIQEELKFDNLYQLIMERDQLKKELFNDSFISSIGKDIYKWYSVSEAGKVLGDGKPIAPSSLTYYIDSLGEYIIPEDAPSNKYIRLNYLSLLKLKMVLLLKDEFRLNGLRAELGLRANHKNVISTKNASGIPSNNTIEDMEDLADLKTDVESLKAMTRIFSQLLEPGDGGVLQLKGSLQSILSSDTKLLEAHNALYQQLEEHKEVIDRLVEDNKALREKIENTEKVTSKIDEKLVVSEQDREKIIESEKQLNSLTETLRARQQAEVEFESQGLFKRLTGNRSEFVERRIKELLSKSDSTV